MHRFRTIFRLPATGITKDLRQGVKICSGIIENNDTKDFRESYVILSYYLYVLVRQFMTVILKH